MIGSAEPGGVLSQEVYDGKYDKASVYGRVQGRGGGAVGDERSAVDGGGGRVGDHADDAASLAAQIAGGQRPADKPGGEAASIDDGVASESGVGDRAVAPGVGPGADGARHLKKSRRHLCGDAAVKFAFIEQHASTWPVNVMCRMLGVSRSGYYDWRGRPPSMRTTANLALLGDVRRLQARHQGRYGSPRMHAALRAEGHRCSRGGPVRNFVCGRA